MSSLSSIGRYLGRPFGYAVYIHWPYCTQLCSYCNFNKYKSPASLNYEQLESAFITEIRTLLQLVNYPTVTSIYFGGGTPSLAPPATIKAIIDAITERVPSINNNELEVTLEVNPSLSVLNKLSEFRDAGINRLSLGIQSLNNDTLVSMNRDHTVTESLSVLSEACSVMTSERVNIDLMFGLPGQSTKEWLQELSHILSSYHPGHLSLYQLTVERGTPLARSIEGGEISLPCKEQITDMYFGAIQLLNTFGIQQYEVSNYTINDTSMSRHNINYWLGGNYIGIGPGAHSRYYQTQQGTNGSHQWVRSINALTPKQWMNEIHLKGHSMKLRKEMSIEERFEEILVTCLRTKYGLPKVICDSFNINYRNLVQKCLLNCPELFEDEFLISTPTALVPTVKGRAVIDLMLANNLLNYITPN